MNLNELLEYVEIGFQKLVLLMELLQNIPNVIFIVMIILMLGIWIYLQNNHFPNQPQ